MKETRKINLTSKFKLDDFIELANFGSNKIIENIGKDRSHISKAIEYLKNNELLKEHGKWEKGKTKNTRMTKLGLYLAITNLQLSNYNKQYLEFQEKIVQHYNLPKNITDDEKKNRLIELGWDPDFTATYEISLSHIHRVEFGLMSVLNNILVSEYMSLILTADIKKDVRSMIEYKIIESIRTRLQNLTFTNLSLEPVEKEFVINELSSILIAPSFDIITPIIDYFKFDYDDLPNDGNRKFVKEDVKKLLSILIKMMNLEKISTPLTVDLEKYKQFLDIELVKKLQQELSYTSVGSQMFHYNRIEKLQKGELMSVVTAGGKKYDATHKFAEVYIANKNNAQIQPQKVARCAFFRTKLIISVPSELKLRSNSDAFISSYEELKKVFYQALEMIDYTNEYDEYGVDMPVFSVITDNKNKIKRIRVDDLVDDLHQTFTLMLIDRLILVPLERTDQVFANYLKKLKTKEKDFTFLMEDVLEP